MTIEIVRQYCEGRKDKNITQYGLVNATELDRQFCSNSLKFLEDRGEIKKAGTYSEMNIYKLVKINRNVTFLESAADFLNGQGKGFIFNVRELADEIGASIGFMKAYVIKYRKLGKLKAHKLSVPYRYEVLEHIPKPDIVKNKNKPQKAVISVNKDSAYLFAYGGNAEIIRDNILY